VRNEPSVYHDSQAREQWPVDLADIARCSETGCWPNCHAGCFAPEFESASLRADLATIVRFSKQSRSAKEIGSGQQWGRISEFPSGDKTIEWAADQFRKAGIADAHVQAIAPGQPRGLLAATLMGGEAAGRSGIQRRQLRRRAPVREAPWVSRRKPFGVCPRRTPF
jgi:hypothetical protein